MPGEATGERSTPAAAGTSSRPSLTGRPQRAVADVEWKLPGAYETSCASKDRAGDMELPESFRAQKMTNELQMSSIDLQDFIYVAGC